MYSNNFKNKKTSIKGDLNDFLNLLSDTNIELFAMGGTAMVLKDIKSITKDIDFMTNANYETIKKLFSSKGLKEKSNSKICNVWYLGNTRIDIFYDAFIIGTRLDDDWKELSELIKTIGKLKLYILNWYDLIITKLARSENRDIDDIITILEKENLDFEFLKKRYYETAETSLIKDYDYKFKYLESKIK